jgi:hypothetical protein
MSQKEYKLFGDLPDDKIAEIERTISSIQVPNPRYSWLPVPESQHIAIGCDGRVELGRIEREDQASSKLRWRWTLSGFFRTWKFAVSPNRNSLMILTSPRPAQYNRKDTRNPQTQLRCQAGA